MHLLSSVKAQLLWVSNSLPLYLTPTNQTATFGWDGSIQEML